MLESFGLPPPCATARPTRSSPSPSGRFPSETPGHTHKPHNVLLPPDACPVDLLGAVAARPAPTAASEAQPVRIRWISRKPYQQVDTNNSKFNHPVTHGVLSEANEQLLLDYLRSTLEAKLVRASSLSASSSSLSSSSLLVALTSHRFELLPLDGQLDLVSHTVRTHIYSSFNHSL